MNIRQMAHALLVTITFSMTGAQALSSIVGDDAIKIATFAMGAVATFLAAYFGFTTTGTTISKLRDNATKTAIKKMQKGI